MDTFTRYAQTAVVSSTGTEDVIPSLLAWIREWGVPEEILSDNGSAFRSSHASAFTVPLQIHQRFAPPHHQSTNGQV